MPKAISKSANDETASSMPEALVAQEPAVNWAGMVQQIESGDQAGIEALHATFSRGLRYFLSRKLGGHDYEDAVQDTLVMVVAAIRSRQIREPERLPSFVRTIAMRNAFHVIGKRMRARQEQVELDAVAHVHVPETKPDPEREAMLRERTELMKRTLQALSARQREILVRFYLHEHTAEQICRDMHLTETQFHQLKARAKARFGEVGQNQLSTPRRRRS